MSAYPSMLTSCADCAGKPEGHPIYLQTCENCAARWIVNLARNKTEASGLLKNVEARHGRAAAERVKRLALAKRKAASCNASPAPPGIREESMR